MSAREWTGSSLMPLLQQWPEVVSDTLCQALNSALTHAIGSCLRQYCFHMWSWHMRTFRSFLYSNMYWKSLKESLPIPQRVLNTDRRSWKRRQPWPADLMQELTMDISYPAGKDLTERCSSNVRFQIIRSILVTDLQSFGCLLC